MASVIMKSEERKAHEAYVLNSFNKKGNLSSSDREAAECIAARSNEAYEKLRKMEGR